MTKETILKLVRPLAIKWLTRGAAWLLAAKFGVDASEASNIGSQIGLALASVGCLTLSYMIDRWHHKTDLAQEPPKE